MNKSYAFRLSSSVALLTILALVSWALSLPTWLYYAESASFVEVSDTLSDSDLSASTTHAFTFGTQTALALNDHIDIILDPTTSLFTAVGVVDTDFSNLSGITLVAACAAADGTFAVALPNVNTIRLTSCGVLAASTTVEFTIGNDRISNPNVEASYIIRIQTRDATDSYATILDQADTRVAIINDVTVTAAVDTIFQFVISGMATGQTVNDDAATTTAYATTATTVPFGTLIVDEEEVLGQTLTVNTNARNGFSVTVIQDQNLTSATGADIDSFIDGAHTASSSSWQAPAETLGAEDTYGHFGITSEDSSLSSGDAFGDALWACASTTPTEVFYHNGPADGSTIHIGTTDIGYKVEVSSLQEAGTDYTNTLTFVATPIF